jgi:hypothetical protein
MIDQFHVLFRKPLALYLTFEKALSISRRPLRKFDFSRSEIFLKARKFPRAGDGNDPRFLRRVAQPSMFCCSLLSKGAPPEPVLLGWGFRIYFDRRVGQNRRR